MEAKEIYQIIRQQLIDSKPKKKSLSNRILMKLLMIILLLLSLPIAYVLAMAFVWAVEDSLK